MDEPEFPHFARRLAILFALIAGLLVFGTVGLSLSEGTDVWDSFVWALDIVATVGSIQAPTHLGGQNVKVVQIVLGVRYGAVANPETLFYMQSQLPRDSVWAAFGIGRHEFPMLAQAWLLGGHVRVGLEDNVYISKGVLARDNAELVEKGVTLVETLGGSIATPAEARAILWPKGA